MDKRPRILFIDDEDMICSMAKDFLLLSGYDVDTFTDSRSALQTFLKNPSFYNLVVTDQTMPDLTGFELLKKVGEARNDIPRILCSGYSENFEKITVKDTGIDAFFVKPYRFDELIGQIAKLV